MRYLLLALLLFAPAYAEEAAATGSRPIALRLLPGQELKSELMRLARERHLKAAAVVTCVGSLKGATLRLAGRPDTLALEGPLEIVSLVGTFSEHGAHFHLSVADKDGLVKGGHLMEGSHVYTTAEIVVVELEGLEFTRQEDPVTRFPELRIRELK